ncbi:MULTISPECIES: hypothetical protein [Cysteiniphilum]|uniref:Uncharacterized protein n=1 Tax=Cysteiniphilum litorale TaxID=2056700 RepID=A0A8J2Z313_9GAMM|nr:MULTISPECIES: hypothetical protein [Cysteiniphilum]GGF91756.1 hypothetical protein GCM10010995_06200 [Cysteiniphilum litorale]
MLEFETEINEKEGFSFNNMKKTESNFRLLLAGLPPKDELDRLIENQEWLKSTLNESYENQDRLDNYNNLKNNQWYSSGLLPKAMREILQEALETFIFWHSIHIDDHDYVITNKNFLNSILGVGVTHVVFSQLSKLFDKGSYDFSLRNIWSNSCDKLKICEKEKNYITKLFKDVKNYNAEPSDNLTRDIKGFVYYRNKAIAHNSISRESEWQIVKSTFRFILRVYGLLDKHYFPSTTPTIILPEESVYAGFDKLLPPDCIKSIKDKRRDLFDELLVESNLNMVTKEKDDIRPFSYEIRVTATIVNNLLVDIDSEDK